MYVYILFSIAWSTPNVSIFCCAIERAAYCTCALVNKLDEFSWWNPGCSPTKSVNSLQAYFIAFNGKFSVRVEYKHIGNLSCLRWGLLLHSFRHIISLYRDNKLRYFWDKIFGERRATSDRQWINEDKTVKWRRGCVIFLRVDCKQKGGITAAELTSSYY